MFCFFPPFQKFPTSWKTKPQEIKKCSVNSKWEVKHCKNVTYAKRMQIQVNIAHTGGFISIHVYGILLFSFCLFFLLVALNICFTLSWWSLWGAVYERPLTRWLYNLYLRQTSDEETVGHCITLTMKLFCSAAVFCYCEYCSINIYKT